MKIEPKNHGALLVDMIEQMDEFIEMAASDGRLPVLDAIGTVRMLKALIRGDHNYDPAGDRVLKRRARFRQCVDLTMLDFNYGWAPAVEPTEEHEQNE